MLKVNLCRHYVHVTYTYLFVTMELNYELCVLVHCAVYCVHVLQHVHVRVPAVCCSGVCGGRVP